MFTECCAFVSDLSLFTTKSLCEYNPDHPVEVRNQMNQPPDENWGGPGGDNLYQCWPCESSKSASTIAKYAHYQVSMFLNQQQESANGISSSPTSSTYRASAGRSSSPDVLTDSDLASHKGSGSLNNSPSKSKKSKKPKFKHIKFGTNVDLSDEKKWGPQLQEISKLPVFCRVSVILTQSDLIFFQKSNFWVNFR